MKVCVCVYGGEGRGEGTRRRTGEEQGEGREKNREKAREKNREKDGKRWGQRGRKGGGEGSGALHVVLLKLCCLQHLLEYSGGVSEIGQNLFRHLPGCTQLNHAVGRRTLGTPLLPAKPAHKVSAAGQVEASTKQRVRMAPASTAQDRPLHC